MLSCPSCGRLEASDVLIYDESLKRQNIRILPFNPRCARCGAELETGGVFRGGELIFINGTCGSGKTTVVELLQERGFLALDLDCAIQTLRHRKGTKEYAPEELFHELLREIDELSCFGDRLAVAAVIIPDWYGELERFIEERGLRSKLILLRPEYSTAVARCQTRTCHRTVTEERWIDYFYRELSPGDSFTVLDNSADTPEETAARVLALGYV